MRHSEETLLPLNQKAGNLSKKNNYLFSLVSLNELEKPVISESYQ
jgi:hypothetical protein